MPKNKKRLDPKDAAALGMKLRGASNTDIAHALGHKAGTKNSGQACVSKRLRRAKETPALEAVLKKYGATDKVIIQTVMECLVATRVISAFVKVKSDNPAVKENRATARDCDFIDVPDFQVRLRAAELLGRWSGWEKNNLNLNLPPASSAVVLYIPSNGRDQRD